ncbi:MAG: FAD-dependent oxidoreductase, partial [Verrucomicrobiales bacterium]
MTNIEYDVAVIGGGSGGYAAARTTASGGLKTVVVDGGAELGGLCILRGCMPTKALLQATDVLHQAQRASLWGVKTSEVSFDFEAIMQRKDSLIENFASYRQTQLTQGRFALVRAHARFTDANTLELSDGGFLRSRHFVLATGSTVSVPPLAALSTAGCLTSDEALRLRKLPQSLIVLGGGPVAVEFAQFFGRLGVAVTLIQRSPHLVRECDEDAAECL